MMTICDHCRSSTPQQLLCQGPDTAAGRRRRDLGHLPVDCGRLIWTIICSSP